MHDVHSNIGTEVAIKETTVIGSNTTTYGEDVDRSGYESLEFVIVTGTVTDGAYVVSLVHGSAATPTTAVPAAEQLGDADIAAADDDTTKRLGYIGNETIVRLKVVSTGVTTGAELAAVAILTNPHHAPVAD